MSRKNATCYGLTGGATGSLDSILSTSLTDNSMALTIDAAGVFYAHYYDPLSAAAESSPDVIKPDDLGVGDAGRWLLLDVWIGADSFATAAEIITGTEAAKAIAPDQLALTRASAAESLTGVSVKMSSPSVSREMIINLKPVVNAAVNKLDIFTKSGGAVPDATNPIKVMIPDGNGYTQRSRAAAYLSGTSQFILADAANYWSKGSLDAEIKTAWVYAIWDGTGWVHALGGYSGFTSVPTTTTATDDDYFLLEEGSTYARNAAHFCIAHTKIRYQYDTADAPDHTIQATVIDAPQVIWNPKSDYACEKNLAARVTSAGDIAEYSAVSMVVKQSGKFYILGEALANSIDVGIRLIIKTGSATYASATQKGYCDHGQINATGKWVPAGADVIVYLNAGDTIHLGLVVTGTSGDRYIDGDDNQVGTTKLLFYRID